MQQPRLSETPDFLSARALLHQLSDSFIAGITGDGFFIPDLFNSPAAGMGFEHVSRAWGKPALADTHIRVVAHDCLCDVTRLDIQGHPQLH